MGQPDLGNIVRGRTPYEIGEVGYKNHPIDVLPRLVVQPKAGLYLADVEPS
jgi:hypothetical protein